MLISEAAGFVFIHVPKTAGTALEGAFSRSLNIRRLRRRYHGSARDAKELVARPWSEYFSCAFVRNPWDRWLSFYLMECSEREISLEIYLSNRIEAADLYADQVSYIESVSFVGRFEQLSSHYQEICSRIGIPAPELDRVRWNNHGHYRDYYSSNAKALVERHSARDLDAFGYTY